MKTVTADALSAMNLLWSVRWGWQTSISRSFRHP
jgi:hypothetical protein